MDVATQLLPFDEVVDVLEGRPVKELDTLHVLCCSRLLDVTELGANRELSMSTLKRPATGVLGHEIFHATLQTSPSTF